MNEQTLSDLVAELARLQTENARLTAENDKHDEQLEALEGAYLDFVQAIRDALEKLDDAQMQAWTRKERRTT